MSGLLLIYTSLGDKDGIKDLAVQARDLGKTNVAFAASLVMSPNDVVAPRASPTLHTMSAARMTAGVG